MTKKLDMASPGPCGSCCPNVVARPATDAPDSTGATSCAGSNGSDAHLIKSNEIGFLKALGRYRERVDIEIGKASEHGARWWSRRLVEVYEEAGLVRLDK